MRVLLVTAAALLLAAGGFAASFQSSTAAGPIVVRVIAKDFSFSLSRKSIPVGRVRFVLVNRGHVQHDFAIAGRKTAALRPGRSAALEVTFKRAGSYGYRCTIPGHAALGMKGVLRVGKASPAATSTGSTTTPGPPASTSASVRLTKIGTFDRPVFVTAPLGDSRRVFVVEQGGRIREVLDGEPRSAPFLDISDQVELVSERGMLSMAFAPDYAKSGVFYVGYTDRTGNGNLNVVEYRRSAADPEAADRLSARRILLIEKPWENHNAGMLQFGPDGNLYVAVGDGDSGVLHDPGAFAQTLDDLLGGILRIDPRHPTAGLPYSIPESNPFVGQEDRRGEIWSYGLRNPWRFWIDSVTGDLYVGDPGEGGNEEIDYVQGNAGGVNFGWPCFEASARFDLTRTCPGAVPPVYEYDHGGGRCAVIGGVVVHDSRLPAFAGRYLFADYCDGKVRSLAIEDGKATDVRDLGVTLPALSSLGVDGRGRVHIVSTEGGVYRLDPAPADTAG
jgi:glucose/arabinose dehydrogenase